MAIKKLDEIPRNCKQKAASQREHILADIQTALAEGIEKFEFVGEEYNYRNLAQYARSVAREETGRRLRILWMDTHSDNKRVPHYYDRHIEQVPWIEISSIKDEKQERRVFCEIHPDGLQEKIKAHELYL